MPGSWVVQLGQPPFGALQLRFEQPLVPSDDVLDALTTFAARAAHALRSSERARRQSVELERSRALVAVVGQAIAQLSLAHTLETAIERIAELLGAERLAVYLLEPDEDRLLEASGRGLAGPHTRVAERLIELARGPPRRQEALLIDDAKADLRLAPVREQLAETGIEAAVGLPLRVREDLIGLLAVYPPSGRTLTPDELALVTALAAQLAVAVQNARLHEQLKRRDAERREALEAEQQTSRTLRSLYEISRTFAQSLSLETTLEALVRTFTELLGLDAVGIRMPDERAEALVTQALHVRDERMAEAVKTILLRPQPLSPRLRNLLAGGRPLLHDPVIAAELGGAYGLLVPFLERGSTTAIVPVSTPAEVLGTVTLVSLDPGRPLGEGEIRRSLACTRASRAGRLSRRCESGGRGRDRAEQVHHDALPDGRSCDRRRRLRLRRPPVAAACHAGRRRGRSRGERTCARNRPRSELRRTARAASGGRSACALHRRRHRSSSRRRALRRRAARRSARGACKPACCGACPRRRRRLPRLHRRRPH